MKRQRPSRERALAKERRPCWSRPTKCDSLYLRGVGLGLGMACQAFKTGLACKKLLVSLLLHSSIAMTAADIERCCWACDCVGRSQLKRNVQRQQQQQRRLQRQPTNHNGCDIHSHSYLYLFVCPCVCAAVPCKLQDLRLSTMLFMALLRFSLGLRLLSVFLYGIQFFTSDFF